MSAPKLTEKQMTEIAMRADLAGRAAAAATVPTPMYLTDGESHWKVDDGPCGFAWIVIRPGTSRFARFARAKLDADTHYYGGVAIWVFQYNQSMTLKEAYARAFAEELKTHGIEASAGSRMD